MATNLTDSSSHSEQGGKNEGDEVSVLIPVVDTGKPNQTREKRSERREEGVSRRHTQSQIPSNMKGTQLLTSSPPPNMSVNLLECGGCQANTQNKGRTQPAPLRSTNSRGGTG